MKHIPSILTILAILVLLISCEKEVEFDKKLIKPQLVINSFIQQDSLIKVNIASSKPIPCLQSDFKWIDNATVKLFVDDVEKETLTIFDVKKIPTGYHSSGYDTVFFYNSSTPTKRYCTTQTKAEAGKSYRLEVTHPDFDKAICETFIPNPIAILSIDTLTKIITTPYNTSTNLEVKIRFKDTPDEKNYYRLVYRNFSGTPMISFNDSKKGDSVVVIYDVIQGDYINSDDQLINPKNEDANDLLFGGAMNRYNLFTDELIEGKEYQLSFYVNENYFYGNGHKIINPKDEFMKLTVELQSLTREAYLYMRSVSAHNSADGFFTEPVQVFTNIENGVGIFAGFAASQKIIAKGEYPIEGVVYQTEKEFRGW